MTRFAFLGLLCMSSPMSQICAFLPCRTQPRQDRSSRIMMRSLRQTPLTLECLVQCPRRTPTRNCTPGPTTSLRRLARGEGCLSPTCTAFVGPRPTKLWLCMEKKSGDMLILSQQIPKTLHTSPTLITAYSQNLAHISFKK